MCGHLHLLPLAALAARAAGGARLVAVAHGIEAWPDPGPVGRALLRRVDTLVAVSRFTLRRIEQWAGPLGRRGTVVPNAVDLRAFTPGPKRADLAERYGLTGCRTVLIVARLAGRERYKGHEELFAALATLPADVRLLVVGDGDDRARLVAAADQAGVAGRVVWAGYIDEAEKADHYRLADVFALPGRGEGFGIVYLEALACGTPAIASTADASGEALLDGCLGAVVDPDRPAELVAALRAALDAPRPAPADLSTFSAEAFAARWHAVLAGRALA